MHHPDRLWHSLVSEPPRVGVEVTGTMRHLDHPQEESPIRMAERAAMPVVTRPLRYAVRMGAFLAVVGIVAALLHQHAAAFFMRNPPLNALILSVLVLGIALSFRAVLSLEPEVSWIQRFRHGDAGLSSGGPPPLLGPLAALLTDPRAHRRVSVTGMRSVLDGVDSRLDERRETSRYLIALLIFLGLLGTFWGLLVTAGSVGETIRGLDVSDADPARMFETLRAGLEAPLSGMGTAFSTSLFGLASSLVLGFLDLQASQAQNRFANELETWVTSLAGLDAGGAPDDVSPAPSYVGALLEQTVESLDALQGRLARTLDDGASVHAALRVLTDRLLGLTEELRARNGDAALAADSQRETRVLLTRIVGALEGRAGRLDDALGAHLERLLEDGARGRDHAVAEIRHEIRLLARTLSAIADRER